MGFAPVSQLQHDRRWTHHRAATTAAVQIYWAQTAQYVDLYWDLHSAATELASWGARCWVDLTAAEPDHHRRRRRHIAKPCFNSYYGYERRATII
ncbi:hypothetical protein N7452_003460 [Penicillium brevicompactum]|uniref:Uncharacterized protein n=1 Tax=Penicillium brevicompactum TaxID=5074 RepID=A0A9W9QTK6_PENBR|nr:hypothetical protein N7452_003460 [Penicillium brevicompactum]